MKNFEFFDCLESVNASCLFLSLPSSYFWNTRTMFLYSYRVLWVDGNYILYVYRQAEFPVHIFSVLVSVGNFIRVLDILYSKEYLPFMKFSHDELKKSVPFLFGKFSNYRFFLDKFSLAVMVLDKKFFSCV